MGTLSKWRVWLIGFALIIMVILLLTPNALLLAGGELGWSSIPPDQPLSNLVLTVPSFAGRVIHTTLSFYSFSVQNKDTANGKVINGEIWEQVGLDGVPFKFHGVYKFPDGVFHQEIIQTTESSTVIMHETPIQPSFLTPSSKKCTTRQFTSSAKLMSDLLPVFIDPVVLQQQGFHDSGLTKPTRPLPSLTPLARAQLIQKYDSDITVHRLIATQINADGSTLRVRELGTGGRLLFQQGKFSITNNEVNSESWFAYGPVELYLSDSFTDSVFAQSESMKEACRE